MSKPGFIAAALAAALLLGLLLYWRVGRHEGPSPAAESGAVEGPREGAVAASPAGAASPASAGLLSDGAAGTEELARSAVPPPGVAPPTLEEDPAASPSGPGTKPLPPVTAPDLGAIDDEGFAQKYAGASSRARRDALESLQSLLDRTRHEDQILELKREIEWLMRHGGR